MDKQTAHEFQKLLMNSSLEKLKNIFEKYNINEKEAKSYLGWEDEKKNEKNSQMSNASENKKMVLPFCGVVIDNCCFGIKLNYGLYSQCLNKKDKTDFCKTCTNQGIKNGTERPTYGTIQERIQIGSAFRDPKGKEVARFANVMEKLGITREQAEKEAKKLGITIPEEEFELKVVKRGRPKKNVEVADTDTESNVSTPKKRGRPKKEKSVVSELSSDDQLIAGLIKEANLEKKEEKSSKIENTKEIKHVEKKEEKQEKKNDDDDDDDDEEIEVERFKDPTTGIDYYKTEDNILYSMDQEPVGRWNPKTKKVEDLDLDLDED